MHTAVTEAQFDARVGNVKIGFFRRWLAHLAVSVARPPPTAKNHVCLLDFRNLRQGFCVFKSRIIAVEKRSQNINMSFTGPADEGFRSSPGLIAAYDDSSMSIVAADGGNSIIGIDAYGKVWKKCALHTWLLWFEFISYRWRYYTTDRSGMQGKQDVHQPDSDSSAFPVFRPGPLHGRLGRTDLRRR